LLLVLALVFVAFVVTNAIPQNKGCIVMTCTQQTTRVEMDEAVHDAGLDRPIVVQYADYLWNIIAERSLGTSWTGVQLDQMIGSSVPVTASLVAGGMVLTLLLALPLGILAALHPRSLTDRSLLTGSIVGLAVHPFVLGIGLATFFHALGAPRGSYCSLRHHGFAGEALFPGQSFSGGQVTSCGGVLDWAGHLAVPWLVFALFFVPIYLRMVRARFLETLHERYVLTARAKGARERRVVFGHALRNAIGPLLPMIALDAGTAITAAIYVETIFGLPGLGHLAVMGLSGNFFGGHYDLPFILALVLTIGAFVVTLSALADITTAWLDPRVRTRVLGRGAQTA
jgi:peptide/nickel transport system permease protein